MSQFPSPYFVSHVARHVAQECVKSVDVIQTAISSQIGLVITKVGAVRQSSQFDGCGPVGIQQLAYLPPTFLAFVGWKPFRSVRTIAELWDIRWGRGGVQRCWEKWTSPRQSPNPGRDGRIPQPAAAANCPAGNPRPPLSRWTTSTRPGVRRALGDGDDVWRGQKEGSVEPPTSSSTSCEPRSCPPPPT